MTLSKLGSVINLNRGPEFVLFHDAGNSLALFKSFIRWLCNDDGELDAPVDLVG